MPAAAASCGPGRVATRAAEASGRPALAWRGRCATSPPALRRGPWPCCATGPQIQHGAPPPLALALRCGAFCHSTMSLGLATLPTNFWPKRWVLMVEKPE